MKVVYQTSIIFQNYLQIFKRGYELPDMEAGEGAEAGQTSLHQACVSAAPAATWDRLIKVRTAIQQLSPTPKVKKRRSQN